MVERPEHGVDVAVGGGDTRFGNYPTLSSVSARLDPREWTLPMFLGDCLATTHGSRSIPRRLNGRFEGGAATCEPSTNCGPSAKPAVDVALVDGQIYG